MAEEIFASLRSINAGVMIGSFLLYFIFGYLLYAAMFAVVGSAVDQETDTQQLILPVILPLILSIYVMMSAINNPDGALPFWFSMIPFTSPVVMMVRIPFGVPLWQVAFSLSLLVGTFIGMTWVAGKVYRTGYTYVRKKEQLPGDMEMVAVQFLIFFNILPNHKVFLLTLGVELFLHTFRLKFSASMPIAILDFGTNTFNLLIAERKGTKLQYSHAGKQPVKLGREGSRSTVSLPMHLNGVLWPSIIIWISLRNTM